ncbi:MAG: 23S rRNA (pseudouridine(1915)-N(3))-methyltransferase RlmH, partial [Caulobacteraceae bacterium]
MKITLLCVGRLGDSPQGRLARDYCLRASIAGRDLGLGPVETIELAAAGRAAEGRTMLERLARLGETRLFACDEKGESLSSREFGMRLARTRDAGGSRLVIAVGGADGLEASVLSKAERRLAFGPATWPHALARVMLAE